MARPNGPQLPDAMDEAAAYVAPSHAELGRLAVPMGGRRRCRRSGPSAWRSAFDWVAAAPRAALRTVTLDEMGPTPRALGAACLAALGER